MVAILVVVFLVAILIKNYNDDSDITGGTLKTLEENIEKKRQEDLSVMQANLERVRLTDKDLDGLSDEEERKIGTNLEKADSDDDGILDKDEFNIYKSNPIKSDTDGDGYKDGYEVLRGFSPVGTGKLK